MEYRTVMEVLERVTRRRAVRAWWRRLLRRAAGDSREDMEESISISTITRA